MEQEIEREIWPASIVIGTLCWSVVAKSHSESHLYSGSDRVGSGKNKVMNASICNDFPLQDDCSQI